MATAGNMRAPARAFRAVLLCATAALTLRAIAFACSAAFVSPAGSAASSPVSLASLRGVRSDSLSQLNALTKNDLLQPDVEPERSDYFLGFTAFAETINGRAAMIGFFFLILLEAISHRNLVQWLGWQP